MGMGGSAGGGGSSSPPPPTPITTAVEPPKQGVVRRAMTMKSSDRVEDSETPHLLPAERMESEAARRERLTGSLLG